MKRFSKLVIKYRVVIIIITTLLTLVSGYFLKDLQINADITSYLPKSDPVVKLFDQIGEQYGGTLIALIALETDDIFNKETIEKINHLTQEYKKVEDVSYVTSITNVLDIKTDEEGTLQISRLIDEYDLPSTHEDLQELKDYILSKDMYRGRLVSEDAKATLIICCLQEGTDKMKTAGQMKEIIRNADVKEKVSYGGIPFQMMDISEIIQDDLKLLLPLVLLMIFISLLFAFRSLRGVLLPILSVVICTIWTLGLMSILKIPITAISNIIPVILIAIGSAYSIHVISKFNEDVVTEEDRVKQSEKALSEISIPVLLAAVTTMVGFVAFAFGSYLTMIREFGIFSGLGVFFALVISITFVPSVLSLLPVKRRISSSNEDDSKRKNGMARFMDKISEGVLKNEKAIIIGSAIIVLISIFGIPKIQRKVDMLDYFEPGTSIRLAEELLQSKFGGSIPIQILVKGDIQDPVVLKQMKKMEEFLKSQNVHNPQSVADLIEEMSYAMGGGKGIPDSKDKVSNLWFLLEGEDIMSQLVNPDKTEALIQATITTVDTKQVRKLVGAIEDYIGKTNTSEFSFTQTGMPLIYQHLDDSIILSQVQSLIIALILVFICLLILFRSFTGGLIGLAPIGFTLVIIFGFMGLSGIPLDIATVLVGSISIGIGIDYSIHFGTRFRREFKKAKTEREALEKTLETTGEAILINVITVMMGFLVLIFANLIPLRRFCILIAITMVGSGVGAVTLMPAIILLTKAGFVGSFKKFINKAKNHMKRS